MAPRTAKAKKASNTKIAENEAPKKGRGKPSTVEDPETDAIETEVDDVQVIDKKTKRGKKGDAETNGQQETNGFSEEKALPAKKGRKKKADSPSENYGINAEENKTSHPDDDAVAQPESDGQEEVPASGGRGKKPAKKEMAGKPKPELKSSVRGKKKSKQETENEDKEEASEDLVKPAAKGKSRKATQKGNKEPEPQGDTIVEKVKESPKKDGRKRGQTKPANENTPENEQGDLDTEDKAVEHPKKNESKGKKNNAKKPGKTEDESEEAKPEPASKKRKVAKKDEKDDVKNGEAEEPAAEPKPAKGKRGHKKDAPALPAEAEEGAEAGDTANKRRRKADEKVPSADKKSKAPLKNKSSTNYEKIDFSNSSKTVQGKEWNLKISSWNVDGIRAWLTKGGRDYIKYEKPDILCMQETKCAKDKLPDEIANLPGYHAYWQGSNTEGYAGVGIYTTKLAISVQYGLGNEELDAEGRMITAEYEQFYLICTYVPNAGRKLVTLPKRLEWNEEFRKYVNALNEKKPVIICGDMNVAHNEIDLANPKSNKKNAGFTPEERAGMTDLISDGFVDSFRHLHPDDTGAYTFWTYMMNARSKNVGWRLDYFLLSERLIPSLCDSVIRSEVYGSDHCPITLFLHMTSADKPKE